MFVSREPHCLLKPSKSGETDDEKLAKVKPSATRNLILIRHGQYNLNGTRDEERFLTALGIGMDNEKQLKVLTRNFFFKP